MTLQQVRPRSPPLALSRQGPPAVSTLRRSVCPPLGGLAAPLPRGSCVGGGAGGRGNFAGCQRADLGRACDQVACGDASDIRNADEHLGHTPCGFAGVDPPVTFGIERLNGVGQVGHQPQAQVLNKTGPGYGPLGAGLGARRHHRAAGGRYLSDPQRGFAGRCPRSRLADGRDPRQNSGIDRICPVQLSATFGQTTGAVGVDRDAPRPAQSSAAHIASWERPVGPMTTRCGEGGREGPGGEDPGCEGPYRATSTAIPAGKLASRALPPGCCHLVRQAARLPDQDRLCLCRFLRNARRLWRRFCLA